MEVQAESLHAVSETSSGEPHAHRYLFKAQQRSKRSVLLAGATGAAFAGLLMVAQPASAAPMYYVANLTPLNNSGVFATFNLTVDGNILTVTEHATGLQPNMPHPQHIHGQLGAAAPMTALATPASDTDGDGFVELAEGQVSYGPHSG